MSMKMKFNDISIEDFAEMDKRVKNMLTDVVRALTKHNITMIPVKNVMRLLGCSSAESDTWEGSYLTIDDKGELDVVNLDEDIDGFDDYDVISTSIH